LHWMPQRRGFCGFLAKAVTPSPHVQASPWARTTKSKYKAHHAQTVTIKLILSARRYWACEHMIKRRGPCSLFCKGRDACFFTSRLCTLGEHQPNNTQGITRPKCQHQTDHQPLAKITHINQRPSGATLAAFLARGVTPASFPESFVLCLSRRSLRDSILHFRPSSTSSPFTIYFHTHFSIIFMNFFSAFFVISVPFHIKNGSFPLIQIHTGAPLASLHQIPLFLHSKHAFSLPPPTCEKRSRAAHSDLCVAFCTPLLRKPFPIFPLHFMRILRILRMVYRSLTCVPPRNLH